jgi:Pvc16 N-terminal domain
VIADVLVFLRKHLDNQLRVALGDSQDGPTGDKVVFLEGDRIDPLTFQLGAVTELLINVEEERLLRAPDLYVQRTEEGKILKGQPDIRLVLYILFVARFKQYEAAWRHLSKIVEYLQGMRVLDAQNAPGLPTGIDRLVMELVTLGFAEQNEVWSALRTTHQPSVLYRVKLLTFRDQQAAEPALVEKPVEPRLRRIP